MEIRDKKIGIKNLGFVAGKRDNETRINGNLAQKTLGFVTGPNVDFYDGACSSLLLLLIYVFFTF